MIGTAGKIGPLISLLSNGPVPVLTIFITFIHTKLATIQEKQPFPLFLKLARATTLRSTLLLISKFFERNIFSCVEVKKDTYEKIKLLY